MDNEPLIDRIQVLLLGMEERSNSRFDRMDERFDRMEERTNARFDKVDDRLDRVEGRLGAVEGRLGAVEGRLGAVEGRLGAVETKLDSTAREVALNSQLLAPFIHWSHRIEDEVIRLSAQLQEVQARLAKLENSPAQ